MSQSEWTKLKSALTRAKKKGPQAVIDEVDRALARFDVIGWPDQWNVWQRAKDDAVFELRRTNRAGAGGWW